MATAPTPEALPQITIRKKPASSSGKVAVFGMVRNEMYFLPHLLPHYRSLGIDEFWFVDDRSVDGTFEFLMSQPDCGVVHSSMRFGDPLAGKTFGTHVKTIVPPKILANRWVLTVDADEFLLLPAGFDTVAQLAQALERNKLTVARALMMDFFPETLRSLQGAPMAAGPFELCPYFDAWSRLEWPDGMPNVSAITVREGIRPRLASQLQAIGVKVEGVDMTQYKFANVNKSPLAFWHPRMRSLSPHRVSEMPSDRVQLVLAHFKFYPGHEERSAGAVKESIHWNNAVEYRILHSANQNLMDWPLQGTRSRRFHSRQDIIDTGFLYSRLA